MDYHVFRKPEKLKNKTVHRCYYYFYVPIVENVYDDGYLAVFLMF